MKRQSFKFYPSDWASNKNLLRCTHEEKGVWLDIMCVLHDADEYGIVRWSLEDLARAVRSSTQVLLGLWNKGVLKGVPGIADMSLVGSLAILTQHAEYSNPGRRGVEGMQKPTHNLNLEPLFDDLPFIFCAIHAGKRASPVVLIPVQEGPLWFSSRMVEDEYKRTVRGANGVKALASENHPQKTGAFRQGRSSGMAPEMDSLPAPGGAAESENGDRGLVSNVVNHSFGGVNVNRRS